MKVPVRIEEMNPLGGMIRELPPFVVVMVRREKAGQDRQNVEHRQDARREDGHAMPAQAAQRHAHRRSWPFGPRAWVDMPAH